MAEYEDPEYPVGYKRPPRHTQFQPGLSGNVRGRPKGAKNFATVIEQELRTPIEVTENGKLKRISKRQAIVKQTVNKAVAGDPKATLIVLGEARFNESLNPPAATNSLASPEDQVVVGNIVARIRQSGLDFPDPAPSPDPPSVNHPLQPTQSDEGELSC